MSKITSKVKQETKSKVKKKSDHSTVKKKKLNESKISKKGKSMLKNADSNEMMEIKKSTQVKNGKNLNDKKEKAENKSSYVTPEMAYSALMDLEKEDKINKKKQNELKKIEKVQNIKVEKVKNVKAENAKTNHKKPNESKKPEKVNNIKVEKENDTNKKQKRSAKIKQEPENDYKVSKDDVLKILLQLEKEDKKKEKLKKGKVQDKVAIKKEHSKESKVLNKKANDGNIGKSKKNKQNQADKNSPSKKNNKPTSKPAKVEKNEDKILLGKKRKQQKQSKESNESIPKKKAKINEVVYEPSDFDEEQFNSIVTLDNIKKIAEALKTIAESEVAKKKTQIFADYRYLLQASCFKIPYAPKRMFRLKLEHSLVGEGDEVLLIVKDLQRGSKVDYTPTIHHYEDLLSKNKMKGITIMPFNQLKKEYKQYEMQRKLGNTYELFLCDTRVVRHASAICGKIFQHPRRALQAVRLKKENNFKSEVNKALKSTAYKFFSKGNTISIPVGTDKFTSKQIAENVIKVVEYLKENYPGSLPNLRNLMLKINLVGTTALPIYISTGKGPDETPYVVGPKEQRMLDLKKAANEVLSQFQVSKDGKITKLKKDKIENKRKIKEAREALIVADGNDTKKKKKNKKEKKTSKSEETENNTIENGEEGNGDNSSQWEDVEDDGDSEDDGSELTDCSEEEDDDGDDLESSGLILESCEEGEESCDDTDGNSEDDDSDEDDENESDEDEKDESGSEDMISEDDESD